MIRSQIAYNYIIVDAKAALEREGQDAVRAFQVYSNNPSMATANGLSDAGRQLAELQARAQLAGFMVTQASTMQSQEIEYSASTTRTSATTDDWRILYNDTANGKVYAILADYLPNSTGAAANAGLKTQASGYLATYGVGAENQTSLINSNI